jgi:hypothetical protein
MLEWINRKITEEKTRKSWKKGRKILPCDAENMKGRLEVLVPKTQGSSLKARRNSYIL